MCVGSPRSEIYYMGLIDALTQYDTKKKAAHAMKTAKHGVSFIVFQSILVSVIVRHHYSLAPESFQDRSRAICLYCCLKDHPVSYADIKRTCSCLYRTETTMELVLRHCFETSEITLGEISSINGNFKTSQKKVFHEADKKWKIF